MVNTRAMVVADRFYPANSEKAKVMLESELNQAKKVIYTKPRALVCPHAGWFYCLDLAALSWAQTLDFTYHRIIFLGPSHHHHFNGWAIDQHQSWETPLGIVETDQDFAKSILERTSGWSWDSLPHYPEHCLEVLTPWVSLLFPHTPILNAIHGNLNTIQDVEAFSDLITEDDLLVISTDLSHYLDDQTAKQKDTKFLKQLINLNIDLTLSDSACGLGALRLLVALARLRGWNLQLLGYHHSGTKSHDYDRVVGYASVVAV
jgi:AmmeMemoRadiSam system protein B